MVDDIGSVFTALIELLMLALRLIQFLVELIALLVVMVVEQVLRLFGKGATSVGTELRSHVKWQLQSFRKELRSGMRLAALVVLVILLIAGVWTGWHFAGSRPVTVLMDGKPADVTFELKSWTGTRKIHSSAEGKIRVPRFWNYTLNTHGLLEEPQQWTADQVGAQITVRNEPLGVSLLKKAAEAVKDKLNDGGGE